jgi:hypothetical protein
MSIWKGTSRFLVSVYLTVCSASLVSFSQSAQAQSYPCSNVALGIDTYERDQGYQQNNNASYSQTDVQRDDQRTSQRDNTMDVESSNRSGSSSQRTNNSGSSESSNTNADSVSNSTSRSNSQRVAVGGNYGLVGGNVDYSTTNSSSRSNSQSSFENNTGRSEFDRSQNSQNEFDSESLRDGSQINETSINRSTSSDQSSSGSFDRGRQQNDYTRTGTTVVGMNCDRAVQAESERDREMIRQRGAIEQERLRLQRNERQQQSSDDFWNRPW